MVPYNPVLSHTFDAHINVESPRSVKAIKYVTKYCNKGSDQMTFSVKSKQPVAANQGSEATAVDPRNEIDVYQTGRFVDFKINDLLCR